MKIRWGTLAAVILAVSACGSVSPTALRNSPSASANATYSVNPSPSPNPSAAATPSAAPTPIVSPPPSITPLPSPKLLAGTWSTSASYGLLQWSNAFGLVGPDGSIVKSVAMAPPSVRTCYGQAQVAVLQAPLSASKTAVYFLDGDTHIRSLAPNGSVSDVTTVPGSVGMVSFFSVSPDDQRIAVVVEDLANPTATVRLYVEDLRGGGHHVDLLTTSVSQASGGNTMWPMGWHNGMLVVGIVPVCSTAGAFIAPSEVRLLDPTSGQQVADLTGPCVLSNWPSPAGETCVSGNSTRIIDWSGYAVAVASDQSTGLSALSISGDKFLVAYASPSTAQYYTSIFRRSGTGTPVNEHAACLWIDDSHVLAPDAVIDASINYMGFPSGQVSPIAQRGACAGRFPGGL